jgi:hypothetical protein
MRTRGRTRRAEDSRPSEATHNQVGPRCRHGGSDAEMPTTPDVPRQRRRSRKRFASAPVPLRAASVRIEPTNSVLHRRPTAPGHGGSGLSRRRSRSSSVGHLPKSTQAGRFRKNPRFTGVSRADDGTRTHDLLHGKVPAVPDPRRLTSPTRTVTRFSLNRPDPNRHQPTRKADLKGSLRRAVRGEDARLCGGTPSPACDRPDRARLGGDAVRC